MIIWCKLYYGKCPSWGPRKVIISTNKSCYLFNCFWHYQSLGVFQCLWHTSPNQRYSFFWFWFSKARPSPSQHRIYSCTEESSLTARKDFSFFELLFELIFLCVFLKNYYLKYLKCDEFDEKKRNSSRGRRWIFILIGICLIRFYTLQKSLFLV